MGDSSSSARAETSATRPRVLVVDDNPDSLLYAVELLAQCDVQPVVAGDGAEAVRLAGAVRLDLILMDLMMPVLDGPTATRQIRRLEGEQARPRVPVVAYTSLRAEPAWLRDFGIDDRLDKPCDFRTLRDCLLRWCPPRPAVAAAAAASAGASVR